jgi:hypothetical protein
MSGYQFDIQEGLALSASWRHPESAQAQNSRKDFSRQAGARLMVGWGAMPHPLTVRSRRRPPNFRYVALECSSAGFGKT